MESAVTLSPHSLSSFPQTLFSRYYANPNLTTFPIHLYPTATHLRQASRRFPNYPQEHDNLGDDPRNWGRNRSGLVFEDYEEDDEEEEQEDRSLDLLVRFVENVFRKISRKARKAVRLVLPVAISTKLVGFSVNGVIILTFLWVLKAFLEVICTLGTVVFVCILLIRGIWTGISYLQESRNRMENDLDEKHDSSYAFRGA